ncbi:unnamed protein product, partial [marine sediment metagenome]
RSAALMAHEYILRFYFTYKNKFKFHLMSYEKVLLNKESEIQRLAKFCNISIKDLDVDMKTLIKFVS